MNNNQRKKQAALNHNINRDMKCPEPPKQLSQNIQMVKHDDMLEFTQFDTEKLTFEKRFDSLLNGKHITIPFAPISMDHYTPLTEDLIRAQARMQFINHQKTMIIH